MLFVAYEDGCLKLDYVHEFHEEPDTADVTMGVRLQGRTPEIFSFELGPIVGRGFQTDQILQIDIPIPQNRVVATHIFGDDGSCRVVGSSERNSVGNYVIWEEILHRAHN